MISEREPNGARRHLLDCTADELRELLGAMGQPGYRADQILRWAYQDGAGDFEAMSNLPKALRAALAERMDLYTSRIVRRAASKDGTVKLLLEWSDGATSECVWIPTEDRGTGCISSQVGCPVGCRFCASGLDGLQRQLSAGQIVEQVLRIRMEAARSEGRLTNVVFMGLGEPLANYAEVIRAVRTLNAPWGVGLGARRITISTVGLPKQIRRLADEGIQINLALSLHAPSDGLRAELIPWAEKISLKELVSACRYFFERTGREITLEYILLKGVNDRVQHAQSLAQFARQFRCNVNLIRYNPVSSLAYERPTSEGSHAFAEHLRRSGVNAHIRTSRGLDIDAACGQLRRSHRDGTAEGAGAEESPAGESAGDSALVRIRVGDGA